jgi:hypothetical protein
MKRCAPHPSQRRHDDRQPRYPAHAAYRPYSGPALTARVILCPAAHVCYAERMRQTRPKPSSRLRNIWAFGSIY